MLTCRVFKGDSRKRIIFEQVFSVWDWVERSLCHVSRRILTVQSPVHILSAGTHFCLHGSPFKSWRICFFLECARATPESPLGDGTGSKAFFGRKLSTRGRPCRPAFGAPFRTAQRGRQDVNTDGQHGVHGLPPQRRSADHELGEDWLCGPREPVAGAFSVSSFEVAEKESENWPRKSGHICSEKRSAEGFGGSRGLPLSEWTKKGEFLSEYQDVEDEGRDNWIISIPVCRHRQMFSFRQQAQKRAFNPRRCYKLSGCFCRNAADLVAVKFLTK